MAYPDYPSVVRPGISIGYPVTLAQTTIYSLPSKPVQLHSTAALEVSIDCSNFVAVTATTTGTTVAAAFARCTGSTAIVVCKPLA